MASENDIAPTKPSSVEHGNRGGLLHDTHQPVITPRVLTRLTGIGFGEVAAGGARTNPVGDTGQCRRERTRPLARLLQEVIGESLRRLSPDSRESGELSHEVVENSHRSGCVGSGSKSLHLLHVLLDEVRRPPLRLSDGRQHEIGEEVGISIVKDLGVDAQAAEVPSPIDRDSHQIGPGARFDHPVAKLGLQLLQPTLHVLPQLKKVLNISHWIHFVQWETPLESCSRRGLVNDL